MNNADLADEIIARLNKLIEDPKVRADVGKLIETRIRCSEETRNHPTIQAGWDDVEGSPPHVGFLGVLNGLVGTIGEGRLAKWGFISAVFDDDKNLERFRRTDSRPPESK